MKRTKFDFNDNKCWYKDGKLHREDGPAVKFLSGTKWWYQNGKRHHLNGPAIEYHDGRVEWWLEGAKYEEEEFKRQILIMNLSGLI